MSLERPAAYDQVARRFLALVRVSVMTRYGAHPPFYRGRVQVDRSSTHQTGFVLFRFRVILESLDQTFFRILLEKQRTGGSRKTPRMDSGDEGRDRNAYKAPGVDRYRHEQTHCMRRSDYDSHHIP